MSCRAEPRRAFLKGGMDGHPGFARGLEDGAGLPIRPVAGARMKCVGPGQDLRNRQCAAGARDIANRDAGEQLAES